MKFPEELRHKIADDDVKVGSVIKLYDIEAGKDKWHIVVGTDNDKLLTATVRINSEINAKMPPKIRKYQQYIKKEDYHFLKHDSYVNCSMLIEHNRSRLITHVKNNPGLVLGYIEEKQIDEIRSIIADCVTIEPKQKKQFGLI